VRGRTAAAALLVVLPLTVGLPLREQLRYYDTHRDRVTVVPPGGSGHLDHASWRVGDIRAVRTGVRVRLDETTLDDQAPVVLPDSDSPDIDYLVYDRSGRDWSAEPVAVDDSATSDEVSVITLDAYVPADVAGQVEFVVRYRPLTNTPAPAQRLRFRR
jgi:hypothetical protein